MLCTCGAGVAYFCCLFRNWCPEIFMGSSRLSLFLFLTGISSYVWLTSEWFSLLLCWKIFIITTTLIIILYLCFCLFCWAGLQLLWSSGYWKTWLLISFAVQHLGKQQPLSQYRWERAILYNFMGICQSISHCWKVLGFFVCLFLLRPCSKLFKYTLGKAICSLNTPAPYLYSLQNLLSPRPWFPRFGRVPVKINHIRVMTFILGAI